MKNDDSIFNDESEILYIKKNTSKKLLKNENSSINSYKQKKTDENISEIKYNKKSSKDISIKKIKKNYFKSCDNIHVN